VHWAWAVLLLQLGSMVLLQQLLTMESLISSSSSSSQAVFARQLQRAGLNQNLPVLMQAAAAHLAAFRTATRCCWQQNAAVACVLMSQLQQLTAWRPSLLCCYMWTTQSMSSSDLCT
jgi:hypothetical protein